MLCLERLSILKCDFTPHKFGVVGVAVAELSS